jgi:hypothetical protein
VYGDEETARRRDELAKRMLNMPSQPLKPKIDKSKLKRGAPSEQGASQRKTKGKS